MQDATLCQDYKYRIRYLLNYLKFLSFISIAGLLSLDLSHNLLTDLDHVSLESLG